MLNPKDYITLAFSAVALCLSLYNYYESRKDTRAAKIRTLERMRFEGAAILWTIMASGRRDEAALEAVRFDAQIAGNAEIVRIIDERLSKVKDNLTYFSEIQHQQANSLAKPVKTGSHEALLAAEHFVGLMKQCQARKNETEIQTANLIAGLRRDLLAASLANQP